MDRCNRGRQAPDKPSLLRLSANSGKVCAAKTMDSIHLFAIAAQNNHWQAQRQSLIASNVANANTPDYKARDLRPFEMVMQGMQLQMAVTKPGHMASKDSGNVPNSASKRGKSWDVYHSGTAVTIETELMKAGEVNRAYTLNTNIMKSFQRMLTSSTRSAG